MSDIQDCGGSRMRAKYKNEAKVFELIEECDKELGNRDWDTEWNNGVKARYMGLILEVMEVTE